MRFYPAERRVVAPATDAFVFSEAKEALRVDHDADDKMVMLALRSAVEALEKETGRAFITQTWEAQWPHWPAYFALPHAPLQSVESITYRLESGTLETLDPASYVVDGVSEPGRVHLAPGSQWPTAALWPVNAITVRFACGYGAIADLPEELTRAIYWEAQHRYDFRNPILFGGGITTKTLSRAVESMIAEYRCRLT